jgi:hypothetical protein
MIDFEIWIKLWQFHLHTEPGKLQLIRIKGGIFRYLIDWHKPEPKPKKQSIVDDENSEPIPF